MSILGTVRDVLKASTESANRGDVTGETSKGAYWCDDCGERIRDVDVASEEAPNCPSCGDEMRFERSQTSTGCAC
jgi:Zn finger protein HypA/HybF involved in hydrogenase expression